MPLHHLFVATASRARAIGTAHGNMEQAHGTRTLKSNIGMNTVREVSGERRHVSSETREHAVSMEEEKRHDSSGNNGEGNNESCSSEVAQKLGKEVFDKVMPVLENITGDFANAIT